ncbi:MAG: Xaa-Pro peptidase family protein [Verrucomicrobiota bacterium]
MVKEKRVARCLFAASDQSADLFYATGFNVPDPVFWFDIRGKSHLLLNPLEVDRGRHTARVDRVLSMSEVAESCQMKSNASGTPEIEEIVVYLLKKQQIADCLVPPDFPVFLADRLRHAEIGVSVRDPFFPSRRKKTVEEIRWITKGQRQAEAGMRRGLQILADASIRKDRKLKWGNAVLTSEVLRFEIEHAVRIAGGVPNHTIVAGGIQSCDPHEVGTGALRAGQTIILDIFPHDSKSGYYGDLTRTVVKGNATDAQRKMYRAVKAGQLYAIDSIRAGIDGGRLQQEVKNIFTEQGYLTEIRDSRWVGFFHGLGHGLGLDIHEAPRIAAGRLRSGDVVTVEPGLYYPDIGGVRLENVVVVETGGNRNLTRVPYRFEIP